MKILCMENGINMIWMWRWIDYLWEKTLKDGQISLRSSKAIFDQEGSSGAEQRSIINNFSCISFRSFHCYFLIIVAVIPKSLNRVGLTTIFVNPLTRWQFHWIVLKTSNKATSNRVNKSSNKVIFLLNYLKDPSQGHS